MKVIVLIFVLASLGVFFEVVFNSITRFIGLNKTLPKEAKDLYGIDFTGYSSIWTYILSLPVILAFLLLQFIPINLFWLASIIGGIVITGIELGFGILLNDKLLKRFNIRLWNYSNETLNYKGHISLFRSIGWVLLSAALYFIVKAVIC